MPQFKKSIIAVLVLLVLGGVVAWSQKKPPAVEKQEGRSEVRGVQEEAVAADLVLDFGEEKIATYSGVKTTEKTVLELLLKAATENDFEVGYNPPSGEVGAFVGSIDGVENTSENFWQFWINGEYGQAAMNQQKLKDGDLVEIKFRGFEQ